MQDRIHRDAGAARGAGITRSQVYHAVQRSKDSGQASVIEVARDDEAAVLRYLISACRSDQAVYWVGTDRIEFRAYADDTQSFHVVVVLSDA